MLAYLHQFVLPAVFTVFVACFLASVVSGLYLILFQVRRTNEWLRHPYLDHRPFERYPISIRAAILLDYFLRLAFPRSQFWVAGQANRLLSHVDPAKIPTSIKWPLMGLWGGCFIGIICIVIIWVILLLVGR